MKTSKPIRAKVIQRSSTGRVTIQTESVGKVKSIPNSPVKVSDEQLGQAAYEAFGEARGWKSIDGQPLLPWSELKTDIKVGWMKAAVAAVTQYLLQD